MIFSIVNPAPHHVPRSAYDRVGGLVYFARMLDKIRLHRDGQLRTDFHANLGAGFDAPVRQQPLFTLLQRPASGSQQKSSDDAECLPIHFVN